MNQVFKIIAGGKQVGISVAPNSEAALEFARKALIRLSRGDALAQLGFGWSHSHFGEAFNEHVALQSEGNDAVFAERFGLVPEHVALNERALSCQERNLNSARLQETTQQTGIVAWARDVLNDRQQLELALFRCVNRDGHGEVDMHEFPGDGGNPCPSGLEFPWVFEDVLEKVSARGFARLRKQWNFAMRPLPPQTMAAGRA
ncbi:hypothetical protein [Polaromonas sp. AET17H-212]|uniref:hypothetical protein n=1 Tax=Polaromonas sp. AET17H-212 TaxID=1977061 RepID=UPI001143BE90|nr:hypothetical protein [Polaromonas sp. AET17H-212]